MSACIEGIRSQMPCMKPQADLGAHLLSELIKLLLANDTSIAKPASVCLYSAVWQLFGLELLQQCKRHIVLYMLVGVPLGSKAGVAAFLLAS